VKKSIATALAVAAAAGAGLVALAGTAGAAETAEPAERTTATGWIKSNTSSYVGPDNQTLRVHTLRAGTAVEPFCFSEGQDLDGNYYWIRINHDGQRGYVHAGEIGGVPAELPNCKKQ
jgi:Bacterial SH3 domain